MSWILSTSFFPKIIFHQWVISTIFHDYRNVHDISFRYCFYFSPFQREISMRVYFQGLYFLLSSTFEFYQNKINQCFLCTISINCPFTVKKDFELKWSFLFTESNLSDLRVTLSTPFSWPITFQYSGVLSSYY